MMYPCEHIWEQRGDEYATEQFCIKCHMTRVPMPPLGLFPSWAMDDEDQDES